MHSSTSLGDTVFVACGEINDWTRTNTIEMLKLGALVNWVGWQIIELVGLELRINVVICPIDSDRLVIFGGKYRSWKQTSGVIFDVGSKKTTVIEPVSYCTGFSSFSQAQVECKGSHGYPGTVIALVENKVDAV